MLFNNKNLITTFIFAVVFVASNISIARSLESSVCSTPMRRICRETLDERIERAKVLGHLRSVDSTNIINQDIISFDNISKIKNYMYQAIENSYFNPSIKNKFKDITKSVVIITYNDLLKKTDLDDLLNIKRTIEKGCGPGGFNDGAFAVTIAEVDYVLICNGFLVTLNQSASAEERFNRILHVLSHELAHHIDNGAVGNEFYASYLNCIAENYSDDFTKTREDLEFCKKDENGPAQCKAKVTLSHSREIIADQWGVAVSALNLKAGKYSSFDSDRTLVESFSNLCGTIDEGIHPSGEFRISILMRNNEEIINSLACRQSEEKKLPQCSFNNYKNF